MSDEQEGRVVEPEGPGTAMREVQVNPIQMIQTAVSRGATLDYVRQLLDLQERWERREAEKAFNEAMSATKTELRPVVRDARNNQTSSDYATLAAIADVVDPIAAKHGLSASFDTGEGAKEGSLRIVGTLTHVAGHSKDFKIDLPLDTTGMQGRVNKTMIHAIGSTMTYGRRYLKLFMFDVPIRDDDGQAAAKAAPRISEEQVANIEALLSETGKTRASFLIWIKRAYKADGIEDLAEAVYQDVVRELEARRREVSGG
jgi:hypothetical protein